MAPLLLLVLSVPASADVVSIELTSNVGGVDLPFTVAQAFREGDVPSGQDVVGTSDELQVVPKNRWPDGSLKLTIVSGRVTLDAGSPYTVGLDVGEASPSAALTTSDLRDTGMTASVGAGSFGTVTWSNADLDAPFLEWVSGPTMSSWLYRKSIGSDPHLVAWMEVRLYAGGEVEVLPWVENGYLLVASPTAKSATYSFTLGGSTRFSSIVDLLNHQRAALADEDARSHWLDLDPEITPRHQVSYLQATKLVPNYTGSPSPGSSLWSRLEQVYAPLGQADFPTAMGTTGYDASIGPLPEWDVAYLTSGGDPRAYQAVMVNGLSAGRYGLHFRDETTNRPPRFSSYPNLVLEGSSGVSGTGASSTSSYTPTASGGSPPTWATSHHPSVGFMAYLVSGFYYFVEEAQFSATVGYLKQNDFSSWSDRDGASGLLPTDSGSNTTRGSAWSLRSLVQAAAITPDDDPLHDEYVASIEANVAYLYDRYVATPNNHPWGVCVPYSDYGAGSDPYEHAIWMEDFYTFTFGYAKDLDLVSADVADDLDGFLAWKYQSIVGRLGGSDADEFCYRDAAAYTLTVAQSQDAQWDGTDPAGTWYSDWGDLYLDHTGHENDCADGSDLRGSSGAEPSSFTGYWGNLLPAIAYAVDHGASGAGAAYARLTGASNYATGEASLDDSPVWAVVPRTTVVVDTVAPSPPFGLHVD